MLRVYYGYEFVYDEMIEDFELVQADVAEDVAENSQYWCNDHAFQLGVRMMRGHLPPGDAGRPLSNMADAAITVLARTVLEDFVSWRGPIAGDGIAVVALGRLGERRMNFEAEVELIFLSDDASVSKGDNFVLDDRADEFCKRFNKFAERMSTGNLLLKSARARLPTDGAGNVTGTLARFANGRRDPDADFLREVASGRIVCASGDRAERLTERFEEARRSIFRRHSADTADSLRSPPPSDPGGERSLRAILNGPGGLDDLELAVLRMRLRHIESHPDIVFESGSAPFLKKAGEHGILESQSAGELVEAANFLLGLECILSLTNDGKPDEAQWEDPVKATVARACDAEEFGHVVAKAKEATARIAAHLGTPTA